MNVNATLPYVFTAHLSAGSWNVSEDAKDFLYGPTHQYSAGKSYGITLNRAVWGPSGNLPYTWGSGRRLYFGFMPMFTDPVLGVGGGAADVLQAHQVRKDPLHQVDEPGDQERRLVHALRPVARAATDHGSRPTPCPPRRR